MPNLLFGTTLRHKRYIYRSALVKNHQCGHAKTERIRIVNGVEVDPAHSQPWIATLSEYIYRNNNFDKKIGSYGCGGTLISRRHILSAAHCAITCNYDSCNQRRVSWATLGDHDKTLSDGERFVPIKDVKIHPNASQIDGSRSPTDPFIYDYCIFVLTRCVKFNDYIQPACLPPTPNDNYTGEIVTVSGWGYLAYQNSSDYLLGQSRTVLRSINIEVLSDTVCQDDLYYNQTYLLCAADPNNWSKDACTYDSGGMYIISRITLN